MAPQGRAAETGKRLAIVKLGCSSRGRLAVRAHTGLDPGTDVLSFVFPLHPEGGTGGMRKVVGVIADGASTLPKPIAIVSTNAGTVTGHWGEFSIRSRCAFLEDVDTAFAAVAGWAGPA